MGELVKATAGRGGRGRGDPGAQQRGLISQADINKVTTVENKHCPDEVYTKFSAAKKAKHWQLRNPGKERGVGSTSSMKNTANVSKFAAAVSSAVPAISALTDATTSTATKEGTNDNPDPWLSPNCKNPALACQSKKKKSNN